jgi:hypothetical protein
MLDTFTIDTFTPHVGETFRVIVDEKWEMAARLTSVKAWGDETAKGRPRQPFTLLFHGPADARIPQRMYVVQHTAMEPFELFLVPIGNDAEGSRYEAVFS